MHSRVCNVHTNGRRVYGYAQCPSLGPTTVSPLRVRAAEGALLEGSPALLWSCDRPDPDWVNFKKQEEAPVRMEMLVVVGHSLLVLLLATPSLHGNAGVWQFPAYGPSPTPLESPTPRVARAAIPKDLVSGITVAHALIIGHRLTF